MQNNLSIVIPAAGLGRRMKSYGPKALIEVAHGQTVIDRQIDILRRAFPQADITVVVGFEADRVCKHLPGSIRVIENEFYEFTGVSRSIELGMRANPTNRVLVVYGDLVFNASTFANLNLTRSMVVSDNSKERQFEVGVNVVDGKAACFSYGLDTKWAHIAYLQGNELALFRKIAFQRDKRKWFGYEILNEVIEHGGEFHVTKPLDMKLVEIDYSKDIESARLIR